MRGGRSRTGDLLSIEELLNKSLSKGSLFFLFQHKRIFDLWPRVVGETASHAEPYFFQEGILYVRVKASVYLDKYRYSLKEWVARYQAELGAPVVEEIRLRLGHCGDKTKGAA
jgi:predicted nucleic acid-binding Zn ribbon protein